MTAKKYVLPGPNRLQALMCHDVMTNISITPISRWGMEITTDDATFSVSAFCETADLYGRMPVPHRTEFSGSFDWIPSVGRSWQLHSSDPKDHFEIVTLSGVGTPRLKATLRLSDWYQIDYSDHRGSITCKGTMSKDTSNPVELIYSA